jgi:hypothetical protein
MGLGLLSLGPQAGPSPSTASKWGLTGAEAQPTGVKGRKLAVCFSGKAAQCSA